MKKKKPTTPWILAAVLIAVIGICGFGLFRKISTYYSYNLPVFGKDSCRVKVIENHKSALAYWLAKGIKDSVLVNIDAHDDIKRMPDIYIQELTTLSVNEITDSTQEEDYQSFSDKVTNGNFIYAAAKLGIFKEIFWIIPAPFSGKPDQEDRFISLLNYYNFLKKDIKTFKMAEKCFKGLVNGIPFSICSVEALPDIREPIILSIDTDFFPASADNYSEKLINSLCRIYNALVFKNYKIYEAVLAYSVDGGHLNTYHRWIGDLLLESLEKPEIMSMNNPPDRYNTLQQADLFFMTVRYDELADYLRPFIETPNPDPAILTYYAFAMAGLGTESHGYSYAEQACLADKEYCYGLTEIGVNLLINKSLAYAEKFFIRAYELNPQMAHGQFNLAHAMIKNNRLNEAIYYFKEFRRSNGPFPVDFYLGKTYLLKGDATSALNYFMNARTELLRNPPALADLGDLNIVFETIAFFQRLGLEGFAKELQIAMNMRDKYCSDRPVMMQ